MAFFQVRVLPSQSAPSGDDPSLSITLSSTISKGGGRPSCSPSSPARGGEASPPPPPACCVRGRGKTVSLLASTIP